MRRGFREVHPKIFEGKSVILGHKNFTRVPENFEARERNFYEVSREKVRQEFLRTEKNF